MNQRAEESEARLFDDLSGAWAEGDETARNRLIELVHGELETIASHVLRGEQRCISLVTGDLVNEAILKVLQLREVRLNDRAHLLALSARVMRRVLIDAARRRNAGKRDGQRVTLAADAGGPVGPTMDLMALERALVRLSALDVERARIVEMRYFAGMSLEEVAAVLQVSPATVKRSWMVARAWLREAMDNDVAS